MTRRLAPVAALLAALPAAAGTIAVRGRTVHTVAGAPIENGVVVVKDGKITAVGPAASVAIPEGAKVLEAAVVTPGLVDAHSVLGLTGHLNQPHDQDQLDTAAPIQPELRAIDAYDARERLVEWARSFGVTTVHTGHAPGAVISGQTMIVKTRGDTVAQAMVRAEAMVAATLGEGAVTKEEKKTPGTRSKAVAILRAELVKAQAYVKKVGGADPEKRPDRDLHLEALGKVLAGELPLLLTAQRHQDIVTALRLAEEFRLKLVLDGAAEGYLVAGEIQHAGVPVIVHPTMQRATGETENLAMTTAAKLADAGIPIALQSGYEAYVPKTRVVLLEAAIAAAHGLGPERALHAITLGPARILGLADRVGSLEVGKDGDLALYDGDPFEYTTHCVGTIIEGEVVSTTVR